MILHATNSHRCPSCNSLHIAAINELRTRDAIKLQKQKLNKTQSDNYQTRKKYFEGKPGCQCKQEQMCKQCFDTLQVAVTKYVEGCGKTWEEEFGGMAAGPAWVQCKDNFFLCNTCSYQLNKIKSVLKYYPHVKLVHIPEQQKLFWIPKYSYY